MGRKRWRESWILSKGSLKKKIGSSTLASCVHVPWKVIQYAADIDINLFMLHNALLQHTHTRAHRPRRRHKHTECSLLFLLNAFPHTTRLLQGMSSALVKTPLSVSLSHGAALQCFSAHAQTDGERATASLSSQKNINRLHRRRTLWLPLHAALVLQEQKSHLSNTQKKTSLMDVWAVKMHERGLSWCHRSRTCDALFAGRLLVSRSLRLPHASYTAAVQYRMKSIFMLSYCLIQVNIHQLPLQSLPL